jgi:pSer/pThr/pTyr-binding forkhead associated (FHA) protein
MRASFRERKRPAAQPVALPEAGVATVGRSSRCDVVVADPTVSRRHLELRAEDGGWVAVDLGSTNGTWIMGRRVGRARVAAGDELVLGDRPIVLG